jgi:hypothetical protein
MCFSNNKEGKIYDDILETNDTGGSGVSSCASRFYAKYTGTIHNSAGCPGLGTERDAE